MKKDSIGNFVERLKGELGISVRELGEKEMPELPMELFGLYEQTGDRERYDGVYLTRRKYLAVFGLQALSQKYEKGFVADEDADRLAGIMEEICREECWAVPAHVDRRNPKWRITADLFACETAQTLAELSDRLAAELPGAVRNMVRENIDRRIFRPFFSVPSPSFWWEEGDTNWNAVCVGAIGSACLHLMREEEKKLRQCLERVIKALTHYLDGFSEDGVCLEGLGYYTYGMTYFVNFAQELYEYTGEERDLFAGKWGPEETKAADRAEKLRRMAGFLEKCFFRDGRMICFSDDCSEDTYRLGMYCVMAMHYTDLRFPQITQAAGLHTDFCYRFAALKMDLLYTQEYLKLTREAAPLKTGRTGSFHVFSAAQWCIGNAVSGAGFACKGGYNEEPHNHNDVGHFIYERNGVMLLTDLGAGEYTKEYFGENRYSILCNSSFGHSVPVIDGKGQCAGREHRCTEFCSDGAGRVEMELRDAYPDGLLESFRRSFDFDLNTGELRVEDRFCFFGGRGIPQVRESLITRVRPGVSLEGVLLEEHGISCRIVPDGASQEEICIEECIHRSHKRENEKVYIIRWEVPADGQRARGGFRVFQA